MKLKKAGTDRTKSAMTILVTVLFMGFTSLKAQDHIYSQFFNAPVYLNPALNGQFEGDLRINMIYRNQWTSTPGQLRYFTASVDYSVPSFGGGIGLMYTSSTEGTANLTKNNLSGIYSYSVGSDNYVLSFGIQAGITNRKIDFDKIIFSDQIDPRLGYIPGSTSAAEAPIFNNRYLFDAGAGVNLVVGNFMAGYAMQHINKPDESFTGTPSLLERRNTVHASYRYSLNRLDPYDEDAAYLVPSVVYYKQAKVNSLSAGMQMKYRNINLGMWYRTNGMSKSDAIVASFIFNIPINRDKGERVRMGMSHDATVSRLNYTNTSGTTEGSLAYETSFPNRSPYRKLSENVRCYDFY